MARRAGPYAATSATATKSSGMKTNVTASRFETRYSSPRSGNLTNVERAKPTVPPTIASIVARLSTSRALRSRLCDEPTVPIAGSS